MTTSRKEAREALATMLQNSVPSAEAVYAYKIGNFEGKSPVLAVLSAGTMRTPITFAGLRPTFYLEIHNFVRDAIEAQGWTEEDVENTLDQVEEEIGRAFELNRTSEIWQAIDYDSPSTIRDVVIAGVPYVEEIIPVKMEVFN
jgi:hypothetical protein